MIAFKAVVCAVFAGFIFWLCGFLEVARLIPVLLSAWGSLCLMFAKELSGRKTVVRDGVEEKTIVYLLWLAAGAICLAIAGMLIYFNS